jgi:hypothetical protein
MRVSVVGIGKSGTTALVYKIHGAMPPDTELFFEPREVVAFTKTHAVAKTLLNPEIVIDDAFYRLFDKTVLIVRDPRDVMVSKALYRIRSRPELYRDAAKLQRYADLLRRKESDPRSVSLAEIRTLFAELCGFRNRDLEAFEALIDYAMSFHDRHPNVFTYRYEDMVNLKIDALADYLELPLAAEQIKVPDSLARVDRSRRSGNWRNWFCQEDVELLQPIARSYMERYGYDSSDWKLNEDPQIRPEESSEYVLRLVRERLAK